MESPDSITPVINEAQEELSTKVVSTGNSASQGAATKHGHAPSHFCSPFTRICQKNLGKCFNQNPYYTPSTAYLQRC